MFRRESWIPRSFNFFWRISNYFATERIQDPAELLVLLPKHWNSKISKYDIKSQQNQWYMTSFIWISGTSCFEESLAFLRAKTLKLENQQIWYKISTKSVIYDKFHMNFWYIVFRGESCIPQSQNTETRKSANMTRKSI